MPDTPPTITPLIITRCFVAGVKFADPDLSALVVGEPVTLVHDKANAYDPWAIRVSQGSNFLGHIPREATLPIHHAWASGFTVEAALAEFNQNKPSHHMLVIQVQVEVIRP